MSDISIKLRNVDLFYSSLSLQRSSLKSAVLSLWKKRERLADVHALKDISLDIQSGERVALLGRNGAGKSTFLKMLAGLYPIRNGEREVNGSIRSLLELSLGFESEATGRENILYRGLMLGLSPKAVRAQADEIVEFAELGEFIDYPIKSYSAGMLVRLAFAITTTLQGDILLLDEILGAGDFAFMQKAQQRVMSLVDQARIVVFATHDWGAAQSFCTRGLVFEKGRLIFDGAVSEAIEAYKTSLEKQQDA